MPTRDAYIGFLRLVRHQDETRVLIDAVHAAFESRAAEALIGSRDQLQQNFKRLRTKELIHRLHDTCTRAIALRSQLLQATRDGQAEAKDIERAAVTAKIEITAMLDALESGQRLSMEKVVEQFGLPDEEQPKVPQAVNG